MALTSPDVEKLRQGFPALQTPGGPPLFFCGPGGSQAHGSVVKAMERYLAEANSNHAGNFLYSRRTDETTMEGRKALADFLNAPRDDEIIFGPNMTTLTLRLSQALGRTLKPGDEIVVTRLDHDANVAPWLNLEPLGLFIRFVDINPEDCSLNMAEMKAAVGPRTKIVAVGYASNSVGTINDLPTIIELAHSVGALVYVDAVHYAPHGPIDVQALNCDFLAVSGYKFFGPHQSALWGRYELLETLPPAKVRPAGNEPPDKFETGTNNFEAIAGMTAAVNYLAGIGRSCGREFEVQFPSLEGRRLQLKTALSAIRTYEKELCRNMIEGLKEIPGLKIFGITDPDRADERAPTVAFISDRFSPSEIALHLDRKNIFVWDGHFYAWEIIHRLGLFDQGGVVRIGACHYNTPQEVETLVREVADMHRA